MLDQAIERLKKVLTDETHFQIVFTGDGWVKYFEVSILQRESAKCLATANGSRLEDVVGVVIDQFISKSKVCDLCGSSLDRWNDCTNRECERFIPF